MANRNYITVEELNFYINNIFLGEELLHNVPVVGEVSGCSVVGGHCYFTLKDTKAQIKVCFFNCEGRFIPNNGEKVLVIGSVDYYTKGGSINVKAYDIQSFGIGALNAKLEMLKTKLEAEGLFREEYKKSLPILPKKIALITSIQGAAVQDFFTTARRDNKYADISIIDVRVQGEFCVNDIITALNNADNAFFDLIILARGGGSYEDLFCFNDENLVRTIFNMTTPVITAIGHETDYTLCDYVSDYRAITPTAAGELVSDMAKNANERIKETIKNLNENANEIYSDFVDSFLFCCNKLKSETKLLLQKEEANIKNLILLANVQEKAKLSEIQKDINRNLSILEQLNPLKLLKRGYFRILKEDKYVYSTNELKQNDTIQIVGENGKISATIKDGEYNEL